MDPGSLDQRRPRTHGIQHRGRDDINRMPPPSPVLVAFDPSCVIAPDEASLDQVGYGAADIRLADSERFLFERGCNESRIAGTRTKALFNLSPQGCPSAIMRG